MKENGKMEKVLLWKPNMKLIALCALGALALLMIPLFRIALYTVPYYDDYNFGLFVKNFLTQERSLASALEGALYCVKTQWHAWQGTYSATFFNSLMPAVWGDQYYFWGPVFLIVILPVSVFVLIKVLVKDVLKADTVSCVALQAVTAAMVVVLLYSPQQGFYWYVGGICYVGMHSFLMLLIAAWIKILVGSGKVRTVLLVLWTLIGAAIAGGATYVTALQGILICIGLIIFGAILKRRSTVLLIPSLLLYTYGFYKNVSAPGNSVRAQYYVGWGYSPIESILRSFLEAFGHIGEFSGWITVAIFILLVPVAWYLVSNTSCSFRYPGLVLAGSFCLYATGFTPSLYAMGNAGYGRTLNAVKITYQLLLVLNEVYWLGWMKRVLEQKKKQISAIVCPWWFYGIVGASMLFIFAFVSPSQAGCYSSYGAYYFVHTGEAYNFYHEYLNRVETIKNSGSDVVVEPYHFKPWFLCIADLNANPESDANRAMAAWYYKNSITCIAQDSE